MGEWSKRDLTHRPIYKHVYKTIDALAIMVWSVNVIICNSSYTWQCQHRHEIRLKKKKNYEKYDFFFSLNIPNDDSLSLSVVYNMCVCVHCVQHTGPEQTGYSYGNVRDMYDLNFTATICFSLLFVIDCYNELEENEKNIQQ